jgi:YVTN family beta-propeller protein
MHKRKIAYMLLSLLLIILIGSYQITKINNGRMLNLIQNPQKQFAAQTFQAASTTVTTRPTTTTIPQADDLGHVVATIYTGYHPVDVKLNPSGTVAYVINLGATNSSPPNFQLVNGVYGAGETIQAPSGFSQSWCPISTASVPNPGVCLPWVLDSISLIDTQTNNLSSTITDDYPYLYGPQTIAINPSGTIAYVGESVQSTWLQTQPNYNFAGCCELSEINGTVGVLSLASSTIASFINALPPSDPDSAAASAPDSGYGGITSVAFNPSGSIAYAATYYSEKMAVINVSTNAKIATIPLSGGVTGPDAIAFSPDGSFAYVAVYSSSPYKGIQSTIIDVINVHTNIVTATIDTGGLGPFNVAFTPSGNLAYVTNVDNDSVSVIDTATNSVINSITLGPQSSYDDVAFTPSGSLAYVTSSATNNVIVIDVADNTVLGQIPVGSDPLGISINSAGTFAYIANEGSSTVSVVSIPHPTAPVTLIPSNVLIDHVGTESIYYGGSSPQVSVCGELTQCNYISASGTLTYTAPAQTEVYTAEISTDKEPPFTYTFNYQSINDIGTQTLSQNFSKVAQSNSSKAIFSDGLPRPGDLNPGNYSYPFLANVEVLTSPSNVLLGNSITNTVTVNAPLLYLQMGEDYCYDTIGPDGYPTDPPWPLWTVTSPILCRTFQPITSTRQLTNPPSTQNETLNLTDYNTHIFAATWIGGTLPYKVNFTIFNSLTGDTYVHALDDGYVSNSLEEDWVLPLNNQPQLLEAFLNVTDNATTPQSAYYELHFWYLPAGTAYTMSNPVIDQGQTEIASIYPQTGIGPFTAALQEVDPQQIGSNIIIKTINESNSITFIPSSIGTFSYDFVYTDLGTKPLNATTGVPMSIRVNPAPSVNLSVATNKWTAGQPQSLNVTITNGTGPFTAELINMNTGLQVGSNAILNHSRSSTISFIVPSQNSTALSQAGKNQSDRIPTFTRPSNNTFSYEVKVTDLGTGGTVPEYVFNSTVNYAIIQPPSNSTTVATSTSTIVSATTSSTATTSTISSNNSSNANAIGTGISKEMWWEEIGHGFWKWVCRVVTS